MLVSKNKIAKLIVNLPLALLGAVRCIPSAFMSKAHARNIATGKPRTNTIATIVTV